MGTRGFLGFVANGREIIAYNHFDSYPSRLGVETLIWLKTALVDLDALRASVSALRIVDDGRPPTAEDVERLRPWTNIDVGKRSVTSWFCLTLGTMGDPAAILRAGVVEDASTFPLDSSDAEYGYVVDLDTETFEAYEGLQREPHDRGRFASCRSARIGVHPCALVASWPLFALPTGAELIAAYGEEVTS